jgi:hypothetical protein
MLRYLRSFLKRRFLADFYLKRNRLPEARKVAEKLVAANPDQRIGQELLDLIDRRRGGNQ